MHLILFSAFLCALSISVLDFLFASSFSFCRYFITSLLRCFFASPSVENYVTPSLPFCARCASRSAHPEKSHSQKSPAYARIRIQFPQLHQLLHLSNYIFRRRRHHWIEIPRRLAVNQIPPPIALPRLHKRKIPANPSLQHILPPIKLPRLLALRHHRAHTSGRIKTRNPRPTRSNSLRKRPLRIQLQLQLPARDQLFEQLVLPHIRRNHLLDLPVLQQQPNPKIVHPGIVADNRQIFSPPPPHRRNQILRYPTKPKPTHQNGRPIP